MAVDEEHGRKWTFAVGFSPEQFDRLAVILTVREQLAVNGLPPLVNPCVLCLDNAWRHEKHSQSERNPDPGPGSFAKDDQMSFLH